MSELAALICGRGSLTFEAFFIPCFAESSTAVQPQLSLSKMYTKTITIYFFRSCVFYLCSLHCLAARICVFVYLYNFVVITADKAAKEK